MIKETIALIALLGAVALSGCVGSGLNSAPAEYVKTVSAIEDGPGLQIYFVLADKDGAMTTSDGTASLKIVQDDYVLLNGKSVNITKSDFQKRSVGMGNFAHDVVMFLVGRVPFENMGRTPDKGSGDVIVTFITPEGKRLEGKGTFFI